MRVHLIVQLTPDMRRDSDGNPLTDQKRWERDIEVKYVVQTGSLKDMSFRIRQANTRATQYESDLDPEFIE